MTGQVILIVEDDQVVMDVLEPLLLAEGYQVVRAACANEAVRAARKQRPDLMLLDLHLVSGDPFDSLSDGFAVLHWLRQKVPKADFPVIIHTADNSRKVDVWARARGVFAVFIKGDDPKELLRAIRLALAEQEPREAA